MFEVSEMDDSDEVTDWATVTGSSPIRVHVILDTPMQKFWLWQHSGTRDLGSEDLDGRTRAQIWESIQIRNPDVRSFNEYRMFRGQDEVEIGAVIIRQDEEEIGANPIPNPPSIQSASEMQLTPRTLIEENGAM
jgi:hypothetical protein